MRFSPEFAIALLAVLVGAAARFSGLTIDGFWSDEIWTMYFSDPALDLGSLIAERLRGETNPPLYYVLVWAARRLGAEGEALTRAMSAVFGTAAAVAPLLYSDRALPREQRLCLSVLLAGSFGAILYAQEARAYALLLFLATQLTLLYFRASRDLAENGRISHAVWWAIVIAAGLAACTHYFGAFLAFAVFALLLVRAIAFGASVLPVLGYGAVASALVLAWPLYQLPAVAPLAGAGWWIANDAEALLGNAVTFLRMLLGKYHSLALWAPLLALAVAYRLRHGMTPRNVGIIAQSLALAGSVVALSAAASLHTPLVSFKYFIVTFPALYVALAAFLTHGANERQGRSSPGAPNWAVIAGAGIAMFASLFGYYRPWKQELRESAAFIRSVPGCAQGTIWTDEGWHPVDNGQFTFRYYLRDVAALQFRDFDPSGAVDAQALQRHFSESGCPVKIWIAGKPWDFEQVISLLASAGIAFEPRYYRDALVVRAAR